MELELRLLPLVTEDVGKAAQIEFQSTPNYEKKLFRRINAQNPYVAEWISNYLMLKTGVSHQCIFLTAILVYDLLERSGRIPKVEKDTVKSMAAELLNDSTGYLKTMIDYLREQNPCVINFISTMALNQPEPLSVALGGVCVYRMLELQVALNQRNGALLG